jgi:hypothetical protein
VDVLRSDLQNQSNKFQVLRPEHVFLPLNYHPRKLLILKVFFASFLKFRKRL